VDKPAGETLLQALCAQFVTGGGRSHKSRICKPLRPLTQERRFNAMHNEDSVDMQIGSFDEIILPHLDAAHNLARWLVRSRDDAEDVVQEACLRAFRYFGTFRGGNARAWLLKIVRTTAFGWLQKNRAQHLATEFDEAIHSEGCVALNPESMLLQGADTQLLEQAMNHVPVRMREVLMLRELEGLSYKEIADVVGVPMGTIMSTLFRARERFRHAASDLVRRQAQSKGSSGLSDAERQERTQDAMPV
jgi:RNA polymerase sigma-70 factor, ECF subfamily